MDVTHMKPIHDSNPSCQHARQTTKELRYCPHSSSYVILNSWFQTSKHSASLRVFWSIELFCVLIYFNTFTNNAMVTHQDHHWTTESHYDVTMDHICIINSLGHHMYFYLNIYMCMNYIIYYTCLIYTKTQQRYLVHVYNTCMAWCIS